MSYSGLPGSDNLYGLLQAERILSTKLAVPVSKSILIGDICLKPENDEYTIAILARLDAWIHIYLWCSFATIVVKSPVNNNPQCKAGSKMPF